MKFSLGKFLLFVLILLNLLFAEWMPFKKENLKSKPIIKVLTSQENVIKLEISIPGIEVFKISEMNKIYQKLRLPGYFTTNENGKPQLPKISELIALPLDAVISVEILDSSVIHLENYNVYPFQLASEEKEHTDFIIDRNFYNKNVFYPGIFSKINKPGIWRDISIAELNIFPIQFNPKNRILKIFSRLVLEIRYTSSNNSIFVRPDKSISKRRDKVYSNTVLNYTSLNKENLRLVSD